MGAILPLKAWGCLAPIKGPGLLHQQCSRNPLQHPCKVGHLRHHSLHKSHRAPPPPMFRTRGTLAQLMGCNWQSRTRFGPCEASSLPLWESPARPLWHFAPENSEGKEEASQGALLFTPPPPGLTLCQK